MSDNFPFKVGDKVVRFAQNDAWVEILYIGHDRFFCRTYMGSEGDYSKSSDWQLYTEPKKTKLVSPVIIPFQDGSVLQDFQENVKPARVVLKNVKLSGNGKWGYADVEADLFFEVEES